MDFKRSLIKDKDLYLFEVESGRALFRLLDLEEYSTIRYILQCYPRFKTELEDSIWEDCIIEHNFRDNVNYASSDTIDAGIITTLSQLILFLSCPKDIDTMNETLEYARASINDTREQAILVICEAFPSYLPEALEKMSWPTLVKRLAQAEQILKKDFNFTDAASQPTDDSARMFKNLEEMSNSPAIDYAAENKKLHKELHGNPSGNFNLHDIRGQ